ncbi:MAG: hypothetical protein QOI10_3997, partial [Solirubrobacterales bacterium]|nr:hypothetical protein [Solirubrobacterales bacterium]
SGAAVSLQTTGCYRRLSKNQKDVNAAHARRRGPGERVTPS